MLLRDAALCCAALRRGSSCVLHSTRAVHACTHAHPCILVFPASHPILPAPTLVPEGLLVNCLCEDFGIVPLEHHLSFYTANLPCLPPQMLSWPTASASWSPAL